jgi:Uma2 family endonuclease
MASAQLETVPTEDLAITDLYRMPLDVYRSMGEQGLLGPDDRIELLDGLLVKQMTKGPRHVLVTHRIVKLLEMCLPQGWCARQEAPIELPAGPDGDSAPEPDVAVVTGALEDYGWRLPTLGEVALVVQVAADRRRLATDRKGLARYAWAEVPAVWIVNLASDTVEVYTGPSGQGANPGYRTVEVKSVGDVIPIAFGEAVIAIAVADMLR